MCTVSFLPLGEKAFILTSNRDEAPGRAIEDWDQVVAETGETVYFPKDPESGGTWIAYSNYGRMVCLLNGAFVPFKPEPPYRMSRGKVVLRYFDFEDFDSWRESFSLEGVAPHTMVIFDGHQFFESIWDGEKKHIRERSFDEKGFWSSVTLYPQPVREWRKSLFEKWTAERDSFLQNEIMEFHQFGGKGDNQNDFVMNRDEVVKTLSITSIQVENNKIKIKHVNLDTRKSIERQLLIDSSPAKQIETLES